MSNEKAIAELKNLLHDARMNMEAAKKAPYVVTSSDDTWDGYFKGITASIRVVGGEMKSDVGVYNDDGISPTTAQFTHTEQDPHGKSPHETGAKLDHGKNRLGLVLGDFSRALWAVGEVGTYGATKYTDGGWKDVPNGNARYTDALYRHLLAEAMGNDRDQDTDLLHAAHAAWNALARLELLMIDEEVEPTND